MNNYLKLTLFLLFSAGIYPFTIPLTLTLTNRTGGLFFITLNIILSAIISYLVIFVLKKTPFLKNIITLFFINIAFILYPFTILFKPARGHESEAAFMGLILLFIFLFIYNFIILIHLKNKLKQIRDIDIFTPIIGSSFFVLCIIIYIGLYQKFLPYLESQFPKFLLILSTIFIIFVIYSQKILLRRLFKNINNINNA